MAVTLYDFGKLHNENFRKQVLARFEEILSKNAFIEGEYNTKFEQEFAKLQGAKHALLVANGTDALEIALQAYDIGQGKKVGVPGISFYATAECVINRGADVVFIDVDPRTGLMDPKSLERTMKKHKLDAIIPVHIYGMPANVAELERICKPNNIKIIEDAAQGQGGHLPNGPIGSSNNLTTFSFYPTKNLGGMGDGGAILTNDDTLAEKIKSIRNHGRSPNGHALVGRNSRCDSFQAAVLHLKLENINELNNNRRRIAAKYFNGLSNQKNVELVPNTYVESSSWHLFPILAKDKNEKLELNKYLNDNGIGSTAGFYAKAMCEEMPVSNCPGEKDEAIRFAARCVCLPMNPYLTDADVELVAKTVNNFYANRK